MTTAGVRGASDRPSRSAGHARRAWIIAGAFGVAWLLFMLAGSDIPPPSGFWAVVVGIAAIVLVLGRTIPYLWREQARHGRWRVVVLSLGAGAAIGLLLAAIFAIRGSGEPSAPALTVPAYAIWFAVVTLAGAVNGVLVGTVVALARPKAG